MDALILTCGTGGGHDMAAMAVKNELLRRGYNAVMMNPYDLHSKQVTNRINHAYISMVQNCPALFGAVYRLGTLYRRLPFRSPVYHINRSMAPLLDRFLRRTPFDVIIVTHLFPAEILTQMREQGMNVPKTVFITTDYTCIPFTEETLCDIYVVPTQACAEESIRRGIPADKIYTLGIPVREAFSEALSKQEARKRLGLSENRRCILLCGGSMGAGRFVRMIRGLLKESAGNVDLIVICGSNEKLYRRLRERFADQIMLLKSTNKIAEYVHACDLYMTKPGGLSTTEAAVAGVPLVHLPPIPGCETANMRFFTGHGMSYQASSGKKGARAVLALLEDQDACAAMIRRQREMIPAGCTGAVCDLVCGSNQGSSDKKTAAI